MNSFDPFLAKDIKLNENKGTADINNLLSTIVIELIDQRKTLLQETLSEVKKAKYVGLIVDSAPHVCHSEDLAVVLHYV